eukprot:1157408-Pelagomonas_calceolata.AAC.4
MRVCSMCKERPASALMSTVASEGARLPQTSMEKRCVCQVRIFALREGSLTGELARASPTRLTGS